MTSRLSSERSKINHLYELIGKFDGEEELRSHLSRYLCIISNGHIEESLRIIYGQYTENKSSHQNITNYVSKDLGEFRNPNTEKILALTSRFSPEWRKELELFLTDEMKDSLNSIVNIKNALAHGRTTGISYITLKKYWENVIKVLDFIDSQCKKS